jgi:intein-encoded DNA endonuclease-like protein
MRRCAIDKQIIINLYSELKSCNLVAKELGISGSTVRKILKSNNIKPNCSDWATKHKLKDKNCLDCIDQEWKAYFLGLFCADGCLHKRGMAEISLAISDSYILKQLAREFYIDTYPYYIRKLSQKRKNCEDQFSIRLQNKEITKSIKNLGITERKSKTLKFPEIPNEFLHHFVRGYFDGDGSISKANRREREYLLSIVGSDDFIIKLSSILNGLDIPNRISPHAISDSIAILTISSKKKMVTFFEWVYKNSSFFLTRKHDKFIKMKETVDLYPSNYRISKYKYIRFNKRSHKFFYISKEGKIKKFDSQEDAFISLCEENKGEVALP